MGREEYIGSIIGAYNLNGSICRNEDCNANLNVKNFS
jgi:hypothetical protein